MLQIVDQGPIEQGGCFDHEKRKKISSHWHTLRSTWNAVRKERTQLEYLVPKNPIFWRLNIRADPIRVNGSSVRITPTKLGTNCSGSLTEMSKLALNSFSGKPQFGFYPFPLPPLFFLSVVLVNHGERAGCSRLVQKSKCPGFRFAQDSIVRTRKDSSLSLSPLSI